MVTVKKCSSWKACNLYMFHFAAFKIFYNLNLKAFVWRSEAVSYLNRSNQWSLLKSSHVSRRYVAIEISDTYLAAMIVGGYVLTQGVLRLFTLNYLLIIEYFRFKNIEEHRVVCSHDDKMQCSYQVKNPFHIQQHNQ